MAISVATRVVLDLVVVKVVGTRLELIGCVVCEDDITWGLLDEGEEDPKLRLERLLVVVTATGGCDVVADDKATPGPLDELAIEVGAVI